MIQAGVFGSFNRFANGCRIVDRSSGRTKSLMRVQVTASEPISIKPCCSLMMPGKMKGSWDGTDFPSQLPFSLKLEEGREAPSSCFTYAKAFAGKPGAMLEVPLLDAKRVYPYRLTHSPFSSDGRWLFLSVENENRKKGDKDEIYIYEKKDAWVFRKSFPAGSFEGFDAKSRFAVIGSTKIELEGLKDKPLFSTDIGGYINSHFSEDREQFAWIGEPLQKPKSVVFVIHDFTTGGTVSLNEGLNTIEKPLAWIKTRTFPMPLGSGYFELKIETI
jgi:hypothetical protein